MITTFRGNKKKKSKEKKKYQQYQSNNLNSGASTVKYISTFNFMYFHKDTLRLETGHLNFDVFPKIGFII